MRRQRRYYEALRDANLGEASNFARYFPVPGMNHCSGGPPLDQFNLLDALVGWVERGEAPASVTATARGAGNAGGVNVELPSSWAANRARQLCPYPSGATYSGSGSGEQLQLPLTGATASPAGGGRHASRGTPSCRGIAVD